MKTLDEQISFVQEEYDNYSKANFANPELIEFYKSVLESLHRLKDLEK
jgi:hypothetical protein